MFQVFAMAVVGLTVICSVSASAGAQEKKPTVSGDEQKLAKAINAATDPAGKLKASADLIQKYPQTSLRPSVADAMEKGISRVSDASQRVSLAQTYQGIFTEPAEQDLILPVLIMAYADAEKPDDAFASAATFLGRHPDSLPVLVRMAQLGTDAAKQRNTKFAKTSLDYSATAVKMIEADQKPAELDDATWKRYKAVVPGLYQSMAVLRVVTGDNSGAKASLQKAAELQPSEPFNYLMLGGILNDEYESAVGRYKAMPDGPAKQAEAPKILTMLDSVIDAYAHMLGLSEGNAQLEPVRQQFLQDLEEYYKSRHNNSTDGMKELIAKYKAPGK